MAWMRSVVEVAGPMTYPPTPNCINFCRKAKQTVEQDFLRGTIFAAKRHTKNKKKKLLGFYIQFFLFCVAPSLYQSWLSS
jgi:hypothetical protein